MTLLVDQLRRRWAHARPSDDMARIIADHVPVYEVSNVVDYLVAHPMTVPDDWAEAAVVDLSGFPNVAPPHDLYWMEWGRPRRLMSDLYATPPERVAVVFGVGNGSQTGDRAWKIRAGVWAAWNRTLLPQATWGLTFNADGYPTIFESNVIDGAHTAWGWGQKPNDDPAARLTDAEQAELEGLDLDARVERLRAKLADAEAGLADANARIDEVLRKSLELTVLRPALMAHSLLACRNVQVADQQPPVKLSKRSERKHGLPLVVFKTLQINPGKARARAVSGDGYDVLNDRRLHIARGHFKTFTVDRPLLGRHVGTYWWAPQVRGSAEHGAVVKDYQLAGPDA